MKTTSRFLSVALALLALSILNTQRSTAFAQGTAFTYQGQLVSGGSPANGLYDFEFTLSNAPAGGSPLGGPVSRPAVGVTNGLFTTTLDFGAVFAGGPAWLAINVRSNGTGGFTALAPLQEVTPTPYALFATTAGNVSGTLPASQLSGAFPSQLTGTMPLAQLPAAVVTNNESSVTMSNLTLSGNLYLTTSPTYPNPTGMIYAGGNPLIYIGLYGGGGNFFAGPSAGNVNETGGLNLGVGYLALSSLQQGANNSASGPQALERNVGGSQNTANGWAALYANLSGFYNTADGAQALYNNSSGYYNTANGYYALFANTTGYYNTANGANALDLNQAGNGNTADGALALCSNTTGSNNVALGFGAGYYVTTGSSNIDIGNPGLATDTNLIRIGNTQSQTFLTGVVTGNGGGLTNLSAAQLTGGLSLAQLPAAVLTNNEAASVTLNGAFTGTFTGDGGGLTNLSLAQWTGGISLAQLPAAVLTNNEAASVTLNGAFSGAFNGNGANVTNVNATALNGVNLTNFWQLGGNTVAAGQFLGSLNIQPLEFWVDNQRALRLEVGEYGAPNVIGGSPGNYVTNTYGATIGGGGSTEYGINVVNGVLGTVSGGAGNTAGASATVGGGYGNTATNSEATIAGGYGNTAVGPATTVGGGMYNTAITNSATVAGGYGNFANGEASTVAGGDGNIAGGEDATVSGGFVNFAGGSDSTVGGGYGNTARGTLDAIGGGQDNNANGVFNTIGGGFNNLIQTNADNSFIGGGWENSIGPGSPSGTISGGYQNTLPPSVPYAVIGGGNSNTNAGNAGTISGGQYNTIGGGFQATVGGGYNNFANANYSTIPGGANNFAGGAWSFAAGQQAQAMNQGAFVWADSQNAAFSSGANDQFLIRAQGGVGLNTDATPDGNLCINTNTYLFSHALYLRGESGSDHNHGLAYCGPGVTNFGPAVLPDGPVLWGYTGGVLGVMNGGAKAVLTWTNSGVFVNGGFAYSSDRNLKSSFAALNPREVLARVAALPVTSWTYTNDPVARHIGPMAQDFHAAFQVNGGDDTHINVGDETGVALAAIQGLNQKLEAREATIQAQGAEIQQLREQAAQVETLQRQLNELATMVRSLAGKK
jgi:hypothetical protein